MSARPLSDVAAYLNETMPDIAERLWQWFGERYPSDAHVLKKIQGDRPFANAVLKEIFRRLQKDLPDFSSAQVLEILRALNGIRLPPLTYRILPTLLADEVCESIIQSSDAVSLRSEIEDGNTDEEYWKLFSSTPAGELRNKIKALTPEAALALVSTAYFWWADRSMQEEEQGVGIDIPPPDFERYFASLE